MVLRRSALLGILVETVKRGVFQIDGEAEPAVVLAARQAACGGNQAALGELLGKKGEDGGGFGDNCIACFECGHFTHRVDGEVIGGFDGEVVGGLGGVVEGQQHGVKGCAAFFEHPYHAHAARFGDGVKGEIFHGVAFLGWWKSVMIHEAGVRMCQQRLGWFCVWVFSGCP